MSHDFMGEESEIDINDAFDNIVLAEERISNEGFEEGLLQGKQQGKIDGYHMGYHRGLQMGMEIGFYKGVIKVLKTNLQNLQLKDQEKSFGLLKKIEDLVEQFPDDNSEDVDIMGLKSEIQVHYKKLVSHLKLRLSFPVTENLSF
ncbi:hypothetical protein RUM44_000956 [Polyplax serrata]|uniref:Essential protein Yae1 N-terminal domain-containing protein n=1 Tax=Polyplax serrata TaxID=468196 RepID=A0ABR1B7H5_POLSC